MYNCSSISCWLDALDGAHQQSKDKEKTSCRQLICPMNVNHWFLFVIILEQGNVSSSDISSMKSANSTSFSSAPRCSTPVYSKQRRTRPFIVCELCRQRAFQTPKKTPQSKSNRHKRTPNDKDKSLQCFSKTKTTSNSTHRIVQHRQASVDQLLVWIVWFRNVAFHTNSICL